MTSNATHLATHLVNKRAVLSAMNAIADSTPGALKQNLANIYHPDAQWRGSHPMNEMTGVEAIERIVWGPLIASFPDLERRDTIVIGGRFQERDYVGMVGHLAGSFRRDWNGIPATDQMIYLRYGEVQQMVDGKIVQSTVLLDVLDFIRLHHIGLLDRIELGLVGREHNIHPGARTMLTILRQGPRILVEVFVRCEL